MTRPGMLSFLGELLGVNPDISGLQEETHAEFVKLHPIQLYDQSNQHQTYHNLS